MSADLYALGTSIGLRHAKLGELVQHQGEDLARLWQLIMSAPPPAAGNPPASNPAPGVHLTLGELLERGYKIGLGCTVPLIELALWQWQPVAGGGAPPSVPPMGPDALQRRFLFRPQESPKLESDKGIWPGVVGTYGAAVQDAVLDGWRPWGGNLKGAAELTVERVTARGRLHTGQHCEHAFYVGAQGWSPKVRALMDKSTGLAAPFVGADLRSILEKAGYLPKPYDARASIAFSSCLINQAPGAAVQLTSRDVNSYGAVESPLDPEGFDADRGPELLERVRASECGVQHPAAVFSLFASEHLASGRKMRRASCGAFVVDCHAENVVEKPLATQLLLAGRQYAVILGGTWRRADMGSTHRPLWSLGDRYARGIVGRDEPGVPAVHGGGPLIVREPEFWSEQPSHVDVLLDPGTPFEWRGAKLEDGSAPVHLRVNGADLGRVDLVEVTP